MIFVITLLLTWLLFWGFMLWRNEWVHAQRVAVINALHDHNMALIDAAKTPQALDSLKLHRFDDILPEYPKMLWRFWVWDIRQFAKEPHVLDDIMAHSDRNDTMAKAA